MNHDELTKIFINEAGLPANMFKDYLWRWWVNPTNKSSLRLTEAGFKFLSKDLDLEYHSSTVKSSLGKNLRIFLLLERHIKTPFYIQRKDRLKFFGSKDAIMLQLMDGDLDQYLENFK